MTIKTHKTIIIALLLTLSPLCHAQHQMSNPGFENWEGSGKNARPSGWSSFPQADGSWAWAASTPQHYQRTGGRPGSTGNTYLTIYSRSVLGIVANGNMTTGQIHAGSTSAASSSNYNYTHRGSDFCHPFSGTPDSMYVWVSFYAANASSMGSVRAYIHGDSDFRDPNDCSTTSAYCGMADAQFSRTTTSATTPAWVQQRVPFTYSGTSTANYLLMSMTTNTTPGGGSQNDSLSIDDIEFIYSAWLDAITINGQPTHGFQRDQFHYTDTLPDLAALHQATVVATPQADDATIRIDTSYTDSRTRQFLITVIAEDSTTQRTYTVTLTCPDEPCQPVSDIAATPSTNEATITWSAGQGNQSWEAEYGPQGFDLGQGTLITTDSTHLTLNGLLPATAYDIYLRAVCSDSAYTDWSPAYTFLTAPDTIPDTTEGILPSGCSANTPVLYPNPANTYVIVANLDNTPVRLTLLDAAGRIRLIRTADSFPHRLDLSNLPSGTYTLLLRTATTTHTQHLTILR